MIQILDRIVSGNGQKGDRELLVEVASQIEGRSFCALGEAAAWPVKGFIRQFPEEFDYWIEHGKSPITSKESLVMVP